MVKLLRFSEVTELTGVTRSHIYKLIAKGRFPSPLKVGPRSVRFHSTDIENWLAGLQPAELRKED